MTVKIDRLVPIVPKGASKRAMMRMARHPDGTIYLALQTDPPTLYSSADNGETWTSSPADLGRPHQVVQGMGVNGKGRIFLIHQTSGDHPPNQKELRLYGQDLFVSYSDDGGKAWTTSETDFTKFGAGTPNIKFHEDGNRAVIEQPDGTLLFNTTVVSSEEYKKKHPPTDPVSPPNFMYGGTPDDYFGDVVLRSTDGGVTWGEPSRVYTDLNAHESTLAIGPNDPNHIMVMTRIQRLGRPQEDGARMMMETGNPMHYYKQGALFESRDAGRIFPPGGWRNDRLVRPPGDGQLVFQQRRGGDPCLGASREYAQGGADQPGRRTDLGRRHPLRDPAHEPVQEVPAGARGGVHVPHHRDRSGSLHDGHLPLRTHRVGSGPPQGGRRGGILDP